jgi:hypothetical protein
MTALPRLISTYEDIRIKVNLRGIRWNGMNWTDLAKDRISGKIL